MDTTAALKLLVSQELGEIERFLSVLHLHLFQYSVQICDWENLIRQKPRKKIEACKWGLEQLRARRCELIELIKFLKKKRAVLRTIREAVPEPEPEPEVDF